jgi:threonine dehydrogenase-like Zn-dependent dehydrogenase
VTIHRLPLGETPHGYDIFMHEEDRCEKVVLTP